MSPSDRSRLFRALAAASGLAAAGFAVLAVILIRDGAYPPPGTGSLGHVGITIAGIIAAFVALFLGGLVFVFRSSAATPPPGRDPE